MTWDQAIMMMVKLAGFKLLVRANRLGCDSEIARDVHDRLIDFLDEFGEDLKQVIACERKMLAERDPHKADDIAYELRDRRIEIEHFWLENSHPYVLGGWHNADADPAVLLPDACDYELFGCPHWVRALGDQDLSGLRPILDQLADEVGVIFPAVTIYYRPDPARLPDRSSVSVDRDAEIPW